MGLLIQVCVFDMEPSWKNAAMKDVPIIQKEMDCAEGMVHISEGGLSYASSPRYVNWTGIPSIHRKNKHIC